MGQRLLLGQDQLEPAAHDPRPLLGGLAVPERQGALGGGDGAARFARAHVGRMAQKIAGRRVAHGENRAALGVDPRPIDESLLAEQAGLAQNASFLPLELRRFSRLAGRGALLI